MSKLNFKPQLCQSARVDNFELKPHHKVFIKYDGIRGIWSGGRFYSRLGNDLKLDILSGTLDTKALLDGEIILPGASLQETVSAVRGNSSELIYVAFDMPEYPGRLSDRIRQLPERCEHVAEELAPKDLPKLLERTVAEGFEGLVVKDTNSFYLQGSRSRAWTKIKNVFTCEEEVYSFKFTDKGNLVCIFHRGGGNYFKVTLAATRATKEHYANNPKELIGKLATIEYRYLSDGGLPMHTSIVAIRDYE